jgi:predicted NUDIX family phosphoesterase
MNKDDEQILVIRSEIIFKNGQWQGLKTDNLDYYLDLIKNHCEFKRRGDVEMDTSFQQVIAYIIFSYKNKYFTYSYLKKAGEQRIKNDYVIGIGGHISLIDGKIGENILDAGRDREWNEEVNFNGNLISKKLVGIINDESRPVERVHLGLVYHFIGDSPNIQIKETEKIDGRMMDLADLSEVQTVHSPWMRIVYNEYLKKYEKK